MAAMLHSTMTGLAKHYGDFVAIPGLSLKIEPGEVVGFVGAQRSQKKHQHSDADGSQVLGATVVAPY